MDKQIALITGANRGIGFEIAKQLAEHGVKVLVGSRGVEAGQAAVDKLLALNLDAELQQLDTTNASSIANAKDRIEKSFGRLDILVNNAGIADLQSDSVPGESPMESIKRTFDTNFFATVAVTQALIPLISKSSSGRIVNVSSTFGSLTFYSDPNHNAPVYFAYSASKAALNMLTVQLADQLRDDGVIVTSICPGFVQTDMTGHLGDYTAAEGAQPAVKYALTNDKSVSGKFWDRAGSIPW